MAKSNKEAAIDGIKQNPKGRDPSFPQNRSAVLSGMGNALKEPGDVEQWDVDKLKEHPDNSRYFQPLTGVDFERLKKDIEENGMHDALIVTAKDKDGVRTVLSGHNRLRAVKALKAEDKEKPERWEKVSVREKVFTTKESEKGFVIRDNLLRRQLDTDQVKALIVEIYGAELSKDGRGGDRKSEQAKGGKSKVPNELLIPGEQPAPAPLAKRVSEDLGISESAAKKHLAGIRNPNGKTAQNRGKKGVQTAPEAPQRTQKGGEGERVGDAGAELLTLTVDFLKAARALRGLRKADVDKALEKIRTLYNACE